MDISSWGLKNSLKKCKQVSCITSLITLFRNSVLFSVVSSISSSSNFEDWNMHCRSENLGIVLTLFIR